MEDNFRNILIIISAVVITAIFIHGLWTIRKQKNPYKLKASKEKLEPISRDFDGKGFDQDGVGQVKVTKNLDATSTFSVNDINKGTVPNTESSTESDAESSVDFSKSQSVQLEQPYTEQVQQEFKQAQDSEQETPVRPHESQTSLDNTPKKLDGELDDWFKEDYSTSFTKDELGDELAPKSDTLSSNEVKSDEPTPAIKREPLYEQPVTQAKPHREPIKKPKRTQTKNKSAINQIEIDFENQQSEQSLNASSQISTESKKVEIEPQVIVLSVVMPANQQMIGAALLPSLLTLGLKYGEMNIFHRHEDNAGNGKVTFSLANILNPGSFDLDSMENFATRGVSLFMTLPNAGNSMSVFEQMLNAAKQLAQEFNAQIIDENRNVMTKQTEQHYISKIREFDRKSRIALVK